jgi:hypothetical protein
MFMSQFAYCPSLTLKTVDLMAKEKGKELTPLSIVIPEF